MSIKGKRDKKSGRIGFDEWNLHSATFPQELVQRVLKEGLELATKEYTAYASLKPDKSDPSRFYVSLPIGPGGNDDNEPAWFMSVTQLVEDYIEFNDAGGEFDEESAPYAIKLRDHLRALANRLDEFIPK